LLSSDKWLICNGAVILRSAYPELFTAIGTLFGAGDGVATFKIPDLSSRFPIGVGTDPLAASGGERTVKLVTAELPAHSHTVPMFQLPATDTNPGGQTLYGPAQGGFVAADITSNDAGSDNPHNNLPPYLAVYFIIRAKP
jgi:microcystin-dependent protein